MAGAAASGWSKQSAALSTFLPIGTSELSKYRLHNFPFSNKKSVEFVSTL